MPELFNYPSKVRVVFRVAAPCPTTLEFYDSQTLKSLLHERIAMNRRVFAHYQ